MAYPQGTREGAADLRADGWTFAEITERLGVSAATLATWDVGPRGKGHLSPAELAIVRQHERAVELRAEGLTSEEIAASIGVSKRKVQSWKLGSLPPLALACARCGEEFLSPRRGGLQRRWCSKECGRILHRQATRAWEKNTPKGRAQRKGARERWEKKHSRPRQVLKIIERNVAALCRPVPPCEECGVTMKRPRGRIIKFCDSCKKREARRYGKARYRADADAARRSVNERWAALPDDVRREKAWRKWVHRRLGRHYLDELPRGRKGDADRRQPQRCLTGLPAAALRESAGALRKARGC